MKRSKRLTAKIVNFAKIGTLIFCVFAASVNSSFARYVPPTVINEPIETVLSNQRTNRVFLQTETKQKAFAEFTIGRLHNFAYASKDSSVDILADEYNRTGIMRPFYDDARPESWFKKRKTLHSSWHSICDHIQFAVYEPSDKEQADIAKRHLAAAIVHLNRALALDPMLQVARIGLAWSYDQSKRKTKAIKLYREVFASAFEEERKCHYGISGDSVTVECAERLAHLLNLRTDAAELKDIKEKSEEIKAKFTARC